MTLVASQLAPTGDLLFLRVGSIWAVGLDIKQRAVCGEPVAVIESIAGTGGLDHVFFAVSRDGAAVYTSIRTLPTTTSQRTAVS